VDENTEPLSWADANQRRSLRDSVDPIRSWRPSGWYKQSRSGNIVLAVNGGTSTNVDSATSMALALDVVRTTCRGEASERRAEGPAGISVSRA
jgi:hypothetical protein